MSKIIYRIKQAIDFKGIGVREFCNMIDVSHGFLTKEREIGNEKVSKIIDILPEIDPIWLLTGKGEMLATAKKKENNTHIPSKEIKEGIPLLPIEALANMDSENISILQYDCEYFIIPSFKGADFLISVRGGGMSPKYNSGDIVVCAIIRGSKFIQWNKAHVIATKEQGVLIKRIRKSTDDNTILAISDNESYEPFEIPKNEIIGIAIIVGVIRLE